MTRPATRQPNALNGAAAAAVALAAIFVGGCDEPTAARSTDAGSATAAPAPSGVVTASATVPIDLDRLVDRTFDDIKFEMEPGDPFDRGLLTDTVRDLDGQRMRIRGYILPTAQKRGIKKFVLVRDNQECCFGPGAALYDCILVTMQGDESAEFSMRPVSVEGRFAIEEFYGPDDYPLAIYRMDGEMVE